LGRPWWNITSAPAVSSRASNRLEVFARGQNNQLITMSWNGSRWSSWSNLGGTITSDQLQYPGDQIELMYLPEAQTMLCGIFGEIRKFIP
jgi:hypothetical protein